MEKNAPEGPWKNWIPGALSKAQANELYRGGLITLEGTGKLDAGACSIDLTLSDEGFEMTDGSVKPSTDDKYEKELKKPLQEAADGSFLLERQHTYVFRLRERLTKQLGTISIHGQATAKSTIGRLDVLARLIVNRMDTYECFDSAFGEQFRQNVSRNNADNV